MTLQGSVILVTGGAGSFGQKFTELALREGVETVRVFDNNELRLVEMERRISDPRARFLLGDIRDKSRLERAMEGVSVVVHAAALKHIPMCEYNPIEAVRTNLEGAVNVIDAALDQGVGRVMDISTDKAVEPSSLYGATKMVAEKLFVQANLYGAKKKGVRLSCARYGNVLASSGSVIPLFLEQQKQGEITLTDERMTRFAVSLEEGVRFVMRSLAYMEGGEVFVPKVPSMRVRELVEVVAPQAKVKLIGLRPGEKIHETLITRQEARRTRELEDGYVIVPEFPFGYEGQKQKGKPVGEDFSYRSDTNVSWLTKEDIRKILETMEHEI